MTNGSTYTSEYHPHPLTFVQKKTRDFPECHVYGYDLDNVVLKCSQCKFSVHHPRPYFPDCLWMLNESEFESKFEPEPKLEAK
jgi:hypothetical protein